MRKSIPLILALVILMTVTLRLSKGDVAFAAAKSFDIVATSSSFSPSSITVDPGDVVTLNFSVPSTDSYCCGLDVRSSAFSTVTIAKGGSGNATFTASSSFTFSSYWPASSIHKADGTVTVQTAAVQPPTNTNTTIVKPTISKVQPGKFKQKTEGSFSIIITGTEFKTGAAVKVGKVKASKVSRLSSTKLKAIIPRKNLAAGKYDVTVTNKDGGKTTKKRAVTIVK
ncbi:MAG: IPT/TIG domain-containing protein [Candidatus Kerfeldbacteria bacterium]|nr:IPT/TIG domain-containing protein [Candidatus Kerfeldbacteria bacterium]